MPLMLGQAAAGVVYLCQAGAPSSSRSTLSSAWSPSATYAGIGRLHQAARPCQQQGCGRGVVSCRSQAPGPSGAAAVATTHQGVAHHAPATHSTGLSHRRSRPPTTAAAAAAGAGTSSTLSGVSPQGHTTHPSPSQQAPPGPTLKSRDLTYAIAHAHDTGELQQLVGAHAKQLDHIHVAAALNRAAQLVRVGGWQQATDSGNTVTDVPASNAAPSSGGRSSSNSSSSVGQPPGGLGALKATVVPLLQQQLADMRGRQLVTSLHSCTRLGWLRPTSRLTQQLLSGCSQHMGELTPQGLTLAVHACALLGITPGPAWVGAWSRRVRGQLGQLQPQDVAVMVWSLGRLRLPLPKPDLWQQLLRRCEALLPRMSPQELLLVGLGAAHAGAPLPAGWLRRWCAAAHPAVQQLQLLELVNLVWALARLHANEAGPLLREVQACVAAHQQQQQQGGGGVEGLSSSSSSSGSGSSSSRSSRHKGGSNQHHQQQQPVGPLQHLPQPGMAAGVALSTDSPDVTHTQAWQPPAQRESPSAAQGQPQVAAAEGAAAADAAAAAAASAAGGAGVPDPQYACKLLWSLAALRPQPGSPTAGVIQEWLWELQLELLAGQPAGVGAGAKGAAAAGRREGGLAAATSLSIDGEQHQRQQQQEEQQQQERRQQQPDEQQQQQQRQGHPGPPFVASMGAANVGPPAQQVQPSSPAVEGPLLGPGGAAPPPAPPQAAAAAKVPPQAPTAATLGAGAPGLGTLGRQAARLSSQHCTMLLAGLAHLQQPSLIHPQLLPYWLQQAAAAMPSAAAGELAGWGWALGRLRYRPDVAWCRAYLGAVAAQRGALDPQEMVMVLWGLARLQVPLDVLWLAGVLEEAAEALPAFSIREVALLVWVLGAGRTRPNKAFMELLLGAALGKISTASERDLVGLVVGLARLGYRPPRRWVGVFLKVVAAKRSITSTRARATIAAALADLGWSAAEQRQITLSML